jgi:hypothetical protein
VSLRPRNCYEASNRLSTKAGRGIRLYGYRTNRAAGCGAHSWRRDLSNRLGHGHIRDRATQSRMVPLIGRNIRKPCLPQSEALRPGKPRGRLWDALVGLARPPHLEKAPTRRSPSR